MKLFLFLSDTDSDFHGVDFLPDSLSEVPDETGMRVNKKYSCLPAEEKGIHIINIRAIEDIGYDQHESTVSKGLARCAAAGMLCFFPYLIPKCSLSLEALPVSPLPYWGCRGGCCQSQHLLIWWAWCLGVWAGEGKQGILFLTPSLKRGWLFSE